MIRKIFLLIGLTFCLMAGHAQVPNIIFPNSDFEGTTLKPWEAIGYESKLASSTVHSGEQALELNSGSLVQTQIKLSPLSSYKLIGWLKTESGSGEVRLKISGLGEHNTGVASTLADWKKVELKFVTGAGQTSAWIEIQNPENGSQNRAWADDFSVELIGKYTPEKPHGIHPLTQRIPKSDLGITQQPNSKMDWLLDAKFGMFIHWGLYAGPAKGEWYMENNGISPEEYRKLSTKN